MGTLCHPDVCVEVTPGLAFAVLVALYVLSGILEMKSVISAATSSHPTILSDASFMPSENSRNVFILLGVCFF